MNSTPKQKRNLNPEKRAKCVCRSTSRYRPCPRSTGTNREPAHVSRSTVPLPGSIGRSTVPLSQSIGRSTGPCLCTSCTPVDRAVDRGLSTGQPGGRPGPIQACFNVVLAPFNFRSLCYLLYLFYLLSPYTQFRLSFL